SADIDRALAGGMAGAPGSRGGGGTADWASQHAGGAAIGGPGGASAGPGGAGAVAASDYPTLQTFKDASERAYILQKLRENDWNITQTAKAIDTPRSNLYKKLEQYGLSREND